VLDSSVVGVMKPDPEIFKLALGRLDIGPKDAVMVGDSPAADVQGARSASIGAVLVDPLDMYRWVDAPRYPSLSVFVHQLSRTS
jgi:FMN phosphatase YigB (HAD superfamily)